MNAESELGRYLPPSLRPFYTKRGFSTEMKERDMMDLSEQCKPKYQSRQSLNPSCTQCICDSTPTNS